MAQKAIVKVLQRYLQEISSQNVPIEFGVLFGSYARDAARIDSDIDILVVSVLFDNDKSLDKRLQLWRVAARLDSRIEPIACGLQQWQSDTVSTIIEIARREGPLIYPERIAHPVA